MTTETDTGSDATPRTSLGATEAASTSPMRLTVVGCSGSFPGPHSPCSCYLVQADGFRLVLDLGNGALGALQHHCGLDQVDAVLLSHLHADHCVDLTSYYVVRNYHPAGRLPRLPVYGPRGTAERIARAYDAPDTSALSSAFDFGTVTPTTFEVGPFRITAVHVNHPIESFAYRVEAGGRTLVYSGDTGESEPLVHLARGADLLLCEASFQAGRDDAIRDVHLDGRQAGQHAARADAGSLLLTHIPPWTDGERNLADAREFYTGLAALAVPGARYPV